MRMEKTEHGGQFDLGHKIFRDKEHDSGTFIIKRDCNCCVNYCVASLLRLTDGLGSTTGACAGERQWIRWVQSMAQAAGGSALP